MMFSSGSPLGQPGTAFRQQYGQQPGPIQSASWMTTAPGYGVHSQQTPSGDSLSTLGGHLGSQQGGGANRQPYRTPYSYYQAPQAPDPSQSTQPQQSSQIQTTGSITQQPAYQSGQTQAATNQAINQALMQGDLRSAMKQYDRPGVSRSAASLSLALPTEASGRIAAADAAAQIPFSAAMTNAPQHLAQQLAREQEAQSWGSIGAQQGQAQSQYNQSLNDLLFNQYQNSLNNQFGLANNTFGLLQALGLGV